MSLNYRNALRLFAVVVLLTGGMMTGAHAEHDDDDDEHMPALKNAAWQTECGSCHVAFPPRLLPAESWRAVMAGLDKHFGSDASLDADTAKVIVTFLESNAGHSRRQTASGKPLLRITETRWFIHEHDEVSAAAWKNPKIKSAANCAACHTQAESGNYSERGIRIPK